MEKLKHVLSHGHGQQKTEGQAHEQGEHAYIGNVRGEGSHLATANKEPHPIYDEFTSKRKSLEPTGTAEQPPHFSNTPVVKEASRSTREDTQDPSAISGKYELNPHTKEKIDTSALGETTRPAASGPQKTEYTDVSTASIKSGVTELPQNKSNEGQTAQAPDVATETSREFPLAGGVTSRKQATESLTSRAEPAHVYPEFRHKHADLEAYSNGSDGKHTKQGNESDSHFSGKPYAAFAENRSTSDYHIPGRFPDPTPIEERTEPLHDKGVDATPGNTAEFERTGVADFAQGNSESKTQDPHKEHDYGRDAAIGAGIGAAGLGAYRASEHPSKETAQIKDSPIQSDVSPYSSTRLDPRVGAADTIAPESLRFDQTTSSKRSNDISPVVGLAPVGTREAAEKTTLPDQSTPERESQDEKKEHKSIGNIALFGAGTAAAAAALVGVFSKKKSEDKSASDSSPSTGQPHESKDATVLGATEQGHPTAKKVHHEGTAPEQPASKIPQPTAELPKAEDRHHIGRDIAIAGGAGATGYGAQKAAKDYGSHRSTQPAAAMEDQRFDPEVKHSRDSNQLSQHHHGREAATAGGLGAGGYGAYKVSQGGHDGTRDPQIPTHDQYSAQPQQAFQQPAQQYVQQPSQYATQSPQKPQHHYGRDAAITGGVGAASYGAHKAYQPEQDSIHNSPKSSERQPEAMKPVQQTSRQPTQPPQSRADQQIQPGKHAYGRDAALASGAGAAGYGAYKAMQPTYEETRQSSKPYEHAQPTPQSAQPASQYPLQSSNQKTDQQNVSHKRYDSVQQGQDDQYQKRDAGALGGAGVAGAGAAYAYSQHEAEKLEKERLKQIEAQQKQQQKELERQQKEQQKAMEREKEHQKEVEKQQKHEQKVAEKEHKKEEKHAVKVAAAEEKHRQKEAEKQEREAEKAAAAQARELEEAEKENRQAVGAVVAEEKRKQAEGEREEKHAAVFTAIQEKQKEEERLRQLQSQHQEQDREADEKTEKKHYILPFLHRKDKRKSVDEKSTGSPRQSKEYAPARASTEGTEFAEREPGYDGTQTQAYGNNHHGRNKLHKDPPPGHPAREAMEERLPYEHVGTEGPIEAARPGQKLQSGVYEYHGDQ